MRTAYTVSTSVMQTFPHIPLTKTNRDFILATENDNETGVMSN